MASLLDVILAALEPLRLGGNATVKGSESSGMCTRYPRSIFFCFGYPYSGVTGEFGACVVVSEAKESLSWTLLSRILALLLRLVVQVVGKGKVFRRGSWFGSRIPLMVAQTCWEARSMSTSRGCLAQF